MKNREQPTWEKMPWMIKIITMEANSKLILKYLNYLFKGKT